MAKTILFSRFFPAYHPKAGEPTFFVEKIIKSLDAPVLVDSSFMGQLAGYFDFLKTDIEPKYHTIRSGNRWKVGDKFSPRVWSGKPYRSKQIIIAPDIEVKKTWDIEISENQYSIKLESGWTTGSLFKENERASKIAMNDGLSNIDFIDWFNKSLTGQIICWNNKIEY